jgi:2-polyprenyl-6-hydroxyphenyl methylase/3-demethylubiquinone-9 3-methyltransferase
MWKAIDNAGSLAKKGGLFYIAIYNKKKGVFGSEFWLRIKKMYNNSSNLGKKILRSLYLYYLFVQIIASKKNPGLVIREYYIERGMNWWRDAVDWLGGYPYEYASVDEIVAYIKKKRPDFQLKNVRIRNGIGNNEFLFRA